MIGGIVLIALSFTPSALLMSILCIGVITGIWYLLKSGW